jgi:foldase protein PrsA
MNRKSYNHLSKYLLATLMTGLVLVSACRGPLAVGDEAPVATVNGQPITEGTLRAALLADMGPRVLVEMIDEKLISQAAAAQHLTADPAQVKMKMDSALSQAGGDAGLQRSLAAQGLTQAQFQDRVALGVLLDTLTLQSLTLTDAQIAQYYESDLPRFSYGPQVHARLILCSTQANAQALREALQAGGDFAGLAQAFSEDPATKSKGGDMGWFEAKDYAPQISKVAFALAPGELSPVFHGPDGYYLLQVEDKRPAGRRPLAEVREEIASSLRYELLPQARQRWIQTARSKVQLQIADKTLAAAVRQELAKAPALGLPTL